MPKQMRRKGSSQSEAAVTAASVLEGQGPALMMHSCSGLQRGRGGALQAAVSDVSWLEINVDWIVYAQLVCPIRLVRDGRMDLSASA